MDRNEGDALVGSWLSEGLRIRIDISREGDSYSGIIAEGLENDERDTGNPDPALRGRGLLGVRIVEGLRWTGGRWRGGTIYEPEAGRRYDLMIAPLDPERVRMRGYLGIPLLGISQTWTRAGSTRGFSGEEIAAEAGLAAAAWSPAKSKGWYSRRPWPIGCNFIPSSAVNEIEMWRAPTFDPATIDRELALAQGLGFNLVRVYLHYLPWAEDAGGLKRRIGEFLDMASGRGISSLLVLFDDCWRDDPHPGPQPKPRPGVHNSGWVRCPGTRMINDESSWPRLRAYVLDIVGSFATDGRVFGWDLYNEIGNSRGFLPNTTRLLARVFRWAREAEPAQPISSGIWKRSSWFEGINDFLAERSDIVSFHNYGSAESLRRQIGSLETYGKPIVCTEYMARGQGSLFETHLPILKAAGVGALSWGLVDGKTQTKYPWGSRRGAPEPEPWFHEIFKKDGNPYRASEVEAIRAASGRAGG
jgi:uncharacterized protein (DUF2147 family)